MITKNDIILLGVALAIAFVAVFVLWAGVTAVQLLVERFSQAGQWWWQIAAPG